MAGEEIGGGRVEVVTIMDKIRNEYIRGTAPVGCQERKQERQD